MRTPVLVLSVVLVFAAAPTASSAEHWLIGGWEDRDTGAVLMVTDVRPDGTGLGTMGGSMTAQRKAAIEVVDARVRIENAIGGVAEGAETA